MKMKCQGKSEMNFPSEVLSSLRDFQSWRGEKERFDLIDYLMCVSTPDSLVAMLKLIKPDLVEFEGEYFLSHQFSPELYWQWFDKLQNKREVQRIMNHLHVSSFIQGEEVAAEVSSFIAMELAHIWSALFVKYDLVAEVYGNDLGNAQITLFRKS